LTWVGFKLSKSEQNQDMGPEEKGLRKEMARSAEGNYGSVILKSEGKPPDGRGGRAKTINCG